ncbi:MAG: hypothetical protein ACI936_002670 [Paraglaciecola sp.]|jgi:hypothetical protein
MSERESVLNQEVRESMVIHKFIYHIIEKDNDEVEHLDQVDLTILQKEFFKNMIVEAARGTRYTFTDKTNNILVDHCEDILENTTQNFVQTSKLIVDEFKLMHQGSVSDGVVIVSHVSMIVNGFQKFFIAILKVDYTKVLAQKRNPEQPSHVHFTEIADSLAEDKKAIQKRALIDISNTFEWDVLAVERSKTNSDRDTESAITNYFKSFLRVRLQKVDSSYTRIVPTSVFGWAKSNNDEDAFDKRSKTYNLIKANDGQNISMDDVRDVVCDTPEQEHSFNAYMDEKELNGVQFTARANSLIDKDNITRMKNENGVEIKFKGTMVNAGIIETDLGDGRVEHKIISTLMKKID